MPTPSSDPNGLAAAIVALAGAILTAVDPSGVIGARWMPAITAAVAVAVILLARRRTWSPQAHSDAVVQAAGHARVAARQATIDELEQLAAQPQRRKKPAAVKKAVAKRR